jgi:hypothetical protein
MSNALEQGLANANAASACNAPEVQGPPAWWDKVADWSNLVAGFVLMAAFLEGALLNDTKASFLLNKGLPSDAALNWLQILFTTEGVLYAVGCFFLVGLMAAAPHGGPVPCMQFTILTAGGIFFALSGLVYPPCVNSMAYVFSNEVCPSPIAKGPYAWNAMAHFGITCFMVGTTIGYLGARRLPRKPIVGPFWGSTMFFLGAWIIGIFKFWGPVLAGGFGDINGSYGTHPAHAKLDMTAPAVTWTWTWWIALIGAAFLTAGAFIFGRMGGSF